MIGQKQWANCSRSCQQVAHWSRLADQGCHRHSLATEYVDGGASGWLVFAARRQTPKMLATPQRRVAILRAIAGLCQKIAALQWGFSCTDRGVHQTCTGHKKASTRLAFNALSDGRASLWQIL